MTKPLLIYFGHHKCASTWIHSVVLRVCQDLSLKYAYVPGQKVFGNSLDAYIKNTGMDFLTYANADITFVRPLRDFKGFHVIRDPRDIVISAYFSHLHSHPTRNNPVLAEHRKELQQLSREEGLLKEIEFSRQNLSKISGWDYSQPNVLELKMEQLLQDPCEAMVRVLSHLGLVAEMNSLKDRAVFLSCLATHRLCRKLKIAPSPGLIKKIPVETLLKHLYDLRFSNLSGGRKPGEEDVTNHYRKGVTGDWKIYFNEAHKKAFKERYGDILIRLGYATDNNNW